MHAGIGAEREVTAELLLHLMQNARIVIPQAVEDDRAHGDANVWRALEAAREADTLRKPILNPGAGAPTSTPELVPGD